MKDPDDEPYDRVLYPGHAYAQAHPDRLAACARLLGLDTTPVEHCRVLELGCGNGANLLAMAAELPGSEFVGIDRSERAIATGRSVANEAGIVNLTLEPRELSALSRDYGQFDYVICHGVYSWVPPEAQDVLLAACQRHLAPQGVAYVSYLTYPGAYSHDLVRDMMLFHAGQVTEPLLKVARGIDFVRFVREAQPPGGRLAAALDSQLARLTVAPPEYVFHDDFAEFSAPVYFAAFVEHAARHGLKFLAEAQFAHFEDPRLPAPLRQKITEFAEGDRIAEQQYLDFLRDTAFRQSLLCHREVSLEPRVAPERLLTLHAASPLRPRAEAPNLATRCSEAFTSTEGGQVDTEEPLAKAALFVLGRAWPDAIGLGALFDETERLARLDASPGSERSARLELFARVILQLAALKMVHVHSRPPKFAASAGERPCVSPLARVQARQDRRVTTLRHSEIRLGDEPLRELLMLMDGTRTRPELLAEMRARIGAGHDSISEPRGMTAEELEVALEHLASQGLLVG